MELYIPENYRSLLTLRETQQAIKYIKDVFQQTLSFALTLDRVTAPIIVASDCGINDDLNGVERKVQFEMKDFEFKADVVQSLAKWKRMALYRYGYRAGEGIYTDMNAIRRDEDVDNTHSVFVDQWDWERVLTPGDRNLEFLKSAVRDIVKAIVYTHRRVKTMYPRLSRKLCQEVFFITAQELEDMYPGLTPKQRENEIAREKRTVFIMQIGGPLKSGVIHDGRAPDYDDWSLNGDLLFWDEVLGSALEVSSMGIRVDANSLASQLKQRGEEGRMRFDYHRMIADGVLPLTIGGGIGQSRLCMLLLEKAHVGEVQVSVWPDEVVKGCARAGIDLL